MYTQCPKCQTVFRITVEQLQARDGLVRCGHCDHVFGAEQRLFDDIPRTQQGKSAAAKKPRRVQDESVPAAAPKPTPRSTPSARRSTRAARPSARDSADTESPESGSALIEEQRAKKHVAARRQGAAVASSEQLLMRRPARKTSVWWIFGSALLVLGLLAQLGYYYRDELAAYPALRPTIVDLCAQIECRLRSAYDVNRLELVQPTNMAPHPRLANALRLRATMVNRAPRPQPYPLLQVALSDNGGRILSRRTFDPRDYLEQALTVDSEMAPNVAVSVLLDVTNPDNKAAGYEIDFVAPTMR